MINNSVRIVSVLFNLDKKRFVIILLNLIIIASLLLAISHITAIYSYLRPAVSFSAISVALLLYYMLVEYLLVEDYHYFRIHNSFYLKQYIAVYSLLALFYNVFVPIYLSRSIWIIVDVVFLVLVLYSTIRFCITEYNYVLATVYYDNIKNGHKNNDSAASLKKIVATEIAAIAIPYGIYLYDNKEYFEAAEILESHAVDDKIPEAELYYYLCLISSPEKLVKQRQYVQGSGFREYPSYYALERFPKAINRVNEEYSWISINLRYYLALEIERTELKELLSRIKGYYEASIPFKDDAYCDLARIYYIYEQDKTDAAVKACDGLSRNVGGCITLLEKVLCNIKNEEYFDIVYDISRRNIEKADYMLGEFYYKYDDEDYRNAILQDLEEIHRKANIDGYVNDTLGIEKALVLTYLAHQEEGDEIGATMDYLANKKIERLKSVINKVTSTGSNPIVEYIIKHQIEKSILSAKA